MVSQELSGAIYEMGTDRETICTEQTQRMLSEKYRCGKSVGDESTTTLVTILAPEGNCSGNPEAVISPQSTDSEKPKKHLRIRFLHSFKRSKSEVSCVDVEAGFPRAPDTSPLHSRLNGWHLQMIAIGAVNGSGLFVGSGKALAEGGPGGVLLGFGILGVMLFCTINALAELGSTFPVQGSPILTSTV